MYDWMITKVQTALNGIDTTISQQIPTPPGLWTNPPWAGLCQLLPIGALTTCVAIGIGTIITLITIRLVQIVLRSATVTVVEI